MLDWLDGLTFLQLGLAWLVLSLVLGLFVGRFIHVGSGDDDLQ